MNQENNNFGFQQGDNWSYNSYLLLPPAWYKENIHTLMTSKAKNDKNDNCNKYIYSLIKSK